MKRSLNELAETLTRINDPELMVEFLAELLTAREAERITGRWEIVKRLSEGVPQRRIAEELGLSLCNITRGSRELRRRESAMRIVLEREGYRPGSVTGAGSPPRHHRPL